MNQTQWEIIEQYVLQRLETENSFRINGHEFVKMFELSPGFYQEIKKFWDIETAKFEIKGYMWASNGDPTEIEFKKEL
jgi:hypothetical protein